MKIWLYQCLSDRAFSSSINGLTFPHDYSFSCKCPFDRVMPTCMESVWPVTECDARRVMILQAPAVVRLPECRWWINWKLEGKIVYRDITSQDTKPASSSSSTSPPPPSSTHCAPSNTTVSACCIHVEGKKRPRPQWWHQKWFLYLIRSSIISSEDSGSYDRSVGFSKARHRDNRGEIERGNLRHNRTRH